MNTKEHVRNRIGFSRMEKKYEWKDHVIFMGLLFGIAVWVNGGIEIKGLYMDDLYFWSCYGEQSFSPVRISNGEHTVPFPLLSGSLAGDGSGSEPCKLVCAHQYLPERTDRLYHLFYRQEAFRSEGDRLS